MLEVSYVVIDEARVDHACNAYFKWKDLNAFVKQESTRGINMPDVISEQLACYALNLLWNRGKVVGDATNPVTNERIEFKATSRFEGDLSSFGPSCYFDNLVYLRFNINENIIYIYDLKINSEDFSNLPANSRQTIRDQQLQNRRPHVSLQTLFVDELNLLPTCIFDIRKIQNYLPDSKEYNNYIQLCGR